MDGGTRWAAVHGVTKSRTQLSVFTFTFHFQALEKEMATHSSVLAWRIPGMGEPGGLLSMGSHRVGHDWSDLARSMHTHEKIWSNLCDRFTQVQYAWERLNHWGIASWSWAHNQTTFPTSLQLDVCMWLSFSQWNVHRAMCTTSRLDHKNPTTHVFSFSSGFRWMDIMIWKSQAEQNNRHLNPWATSWRRAAYQSSIIYILPLWEINHLST